jgi:hypothetical protein
MFQHRRKRVRLSIDCPQFDRDTVRRPEWGEDIWAAVLFGGFARTEILMEGRLSSVRRQEILLN